MASLFKAGAPNSVLEVKKLFSENGPTFPNVENLSDLRLFHGVAAQEELPVSGPQSRGNAIHHATDGNNIARGESIGFSRFGGFQVGPEGVQKFNAFLTFLAHFLFAHF